MKDWATAVFLGICIASMATCSAVETVSRHKMKVELEKLEINKPQGACGEGNE